MDVDILVVGSGCSGLYCALQLPADKKIRIITKKSLTESDSYLAQGGMCYLQDEDDYESYYEDTMKAGHYKNNPTSVEIMIRSSQDVVNDLLEYGVDFQRDENGELSVTKEGAHSRKRILFHEDITGQEITSRLLEEVKQKDNITLCEYTTLLDIIEKDNKVYGAICRNAKGDVFALSANYVVLATGGIGGLYEHSTNYRHLTGDAIFLAIRHNIERKNMDYVQIHPTTLYVKDDRARSFLISESVRGEGAKLYDKNMHRFVDELLPRDVVTQAILEQMKKDNTQFVWEDLRDIPEEELDTHFPNIVKYCKEMGYDVKKECIPVVPAQHYHMGGIKVDSDSRTTMEHLFVVGEAACNGVHGKNRLASNSLLESLVFAKRAAQKIAKEDDKADEKTAQKLLQNFSKEEYLDEAAWKEKAKEIVLAEINTKKNKIWEKKDV